MADKIDDGGSAFPGLHGSVDSFGTLRQRTDGLSMRDWFAGQALAGMLATETDDSTYREGPAADRSYRMADAMIAARKGGL